MRTKKNIRQVCAYRVNHSKTVRDSVIQQCTPIIAELKALIAKIRPTRRVAKKPEVAFAPMPQTFPIKIGDRPGYSFRSVAHCLTTSQRLIKTPCVDPSWKRYLNKSECG